MSKQELNDISNYEIQQFIAYKRSLGYSYNGSILYQLQDIDHMILEFQRFHQFSSDLILSKECVEYIVSKKETNQKYAYACLSIKTIWIVSRKDRQKSICHTKEIITRNKKTI